MSTPCHSNIQIGIQFHPRTGLPVLLRPNLLSIVPEVVKDHQ